MSVNEHRRKSFGVFRGEGGGGGGGEVGGFGAGVGHVTSPLKYKVLTSDVTSNVAYRLFQPMGKTEFPSIAKKR